MGVLRLTRYSTYHIVLIKELSMSNFLLCTTSLMAGNRTRVVLSEPLHGGSLERSVTPPLKLQERRKGSSITGVNHGNMPPQGFSEDHPGPATSYFIRLGCMVTL